MLSLNLKFVFAALIALSAFAQETKSPGGDSKEFIEYSKKESRLNTLKSRITEANTNFAVTLEKKQGTRDAVKQRQYADRLAEIAKERNAAVAEYTALRQELTYRYPNKGVDIDKRFVPKKEKTALELENSSEIDELLTAIKKRVDKKYAPLIPREEIAADTVIPSRKEEPKKKIRLVK